MQYVDDGVRDQDVVAADASRGPFANTGLADGSRLAGLLGYAVDARAGATPAGTVLLARSPFTTAWSTAGHAEMTTYRAASGATAFATGTIQWAWGLDDYNAPELRAARSSVAAQQVTRNLLHRLVAPAAPPPAEPTGLAASVRGASVDLTWVDRATNEDGSEVARAAGAGAVVARLGPDGRRYTDGATARRSTYAYRVRAYNAGATSAYSNTVRATTK